MAAHPKTLISLFDERKQATAAVLDLVEEGFSEQQLSLVGAAGPGELTEGAGAAVKGAEIGAVAGGLGGLIVGLALLPLPGVGPIVAAGPVAATLVGAATGAVGLGFLGALVNLGLTEEHASCYSEGVRRGGTLLIVQASEEQAARAGETLARHAPVDLNQRVAAWKADGWEARLDEQQGKSILAGMAGGAVTGAAVGSVVPGLGTGTAALVGVVTGAMEGSSHPVGTISGALTGAAAGAALGSVVPGLGTGLGAAVGGVAGAVSGHQISKDVTPKAPGA